MVGRVIVVLFLIASASGCTPPPRSAADLQPTAGPLVWPAAPARPRVRFVGTIAQPTDLGVRPSFWRRLGELATGKQQEWLVRPTAVAGDLRLLYVADPGAQVLWAIDTARGRFNKTHTLGAVSLVSPVAVAIGHGLLYVADSALGRVFVVDSALKLRATIVGAGLRRPAGLAFDEARDRLYVADSASHRVFIYAPDGRAIGAIGQRGPGDGEFNFPTHVAVDSDGGVYVTDSLGFRVQTFTRDGVFSGGFGRHGDSSGDFARPKGIAIDSDGHLYVVDALFDTVQIFDRRGRFLLSFGERGVRPGQFWLPVGVFIDGHDRIYVADSYNQRIQIFEYLAGGDDA